MNRGKKKTLSPPSLGREFFCEHPLFVFQNTQGRHPNKRVLWAQILIVCLFVIALSANSSEENTSNQLQDEIKAKETYLLRTMESRRSQLELLERSSDDEKKGLLHKYTTRVPLRIHFGIDPEFATNLRSIQFKVDEGKWIKLNLVGENSLLWHHVEFENVAVGMRNLSVVVKAQAQKSFEPFLAPLENIVGEDFIPIQIKSPETVKAFRIQGFMRGWLSPQLLLKIFELNKEEPNIASM